MAPSTWCCTNSMTRRATPIPQEGGSVFWIRYDGIVAPRGLPRNHESIHSRRRCRPKPESTDGRREGRANWDEGAYKGESLGSIGTDVTRQRVFSSRTGPRERSMEAGNRVIVRSDAAGCTRGPGGREVGGVGSVADGAVRLGVGWLAAWPGREWPAQPRASPGEDAK